MLKQRKNFHLLFTSFQKSIKQSLRFGFPGTPNHSLPVSLPFPGPSLPPSSFTIS